MREPLHELVEHTRRRHLGGTRIAYSNISIEHQHDIVRVSGDVLDRRAADGFMQALRIQAPHVNWRDELTPLVQGPDYHWAINQRAVADVRREPRLFSECVTQALFGEAIEVLRYQDHWAFVRLSDGYLGWMYSDPLQVCSHEAAQSYSAQTTHVVKHPLAPCYAHPSGAPHEQVAVLPFGVHVQAEAQDGPMQRIRWPDGRIRWICTADLELHKHVPPHSRAGLRSVMAWVDRLIGTPYLWGGKTPWGYDCSGLVQVIYRCIGVHLRRDSDQQWEQGASVPFEEISFGDLLFFDNDVPATALAKEGPNRVTHVAIATSPTEFIHAMSRGGGVIRSSFDPRSPLHQPTFKQRFVGARFYLQD